MFSCAFFEIFRQGFFAEHLQATISGSKGLQCYKWINKFMNLSCKCYKCYNNVINKFTWFHISEAVTWGIL